MPRGLWVTKCICHVQYRPNEAKTGSKCFALSSQIYLATLKDLSVLMTWLSPEASLTNDDFTLTCTKVVLTKIGKNKHPSQFEQGPKLLTFLLQKMSEIIYVSSLLQAP